MMVPSSRQLFHASIRLTFLFLVAVLCTNAAFGQAQSNAADLQGFVRDPSGAVVVGATVSVRNAATNFSREATTNDDGYYQITNLPPGSYEITVEASGFSKGRIPSVTLTVGQRADLDIPLTVGEVGATVDIAAAEVSSPVGGHAADGGDQSQRQVRTVDRVPVAAANAAQVAAVVLGVRGAATSAGEQQQRQRNQHPECLRRSRRRFHRLTSIWVGLRAYARAARSKSHPCIRKSAASADGR